MHELVRTNNAVLITAIEALLKSADIPHMVLDQHMSVLEGSLGMLPRRIVVDEEHWEVARQLLEAEVDRRRHTQIAAEDLLRPVLADQLLGDVVREVRRRLSLA